VTPARDVSTSASRTRARAGVAVIRVYDEANRTKQKTSPDKTLTATFLLLDVESGWDVGSSVGSYLNQQFELLKHARTPLRARESQRK